MPHLIVEYSNEISEYKPIKDIMDACHTAALDSGLFGEQDIKVRAYSSEAHLVGGLSVGFIHVTIKLLSGRSVSVKKTLTRAVLEALHSFELPVKSTSVEALDIEQESYSKIVA